MKLFHAPTSPYVRKVLIAARELALADRLEHVAVTAMPQAPAREIAPHNPLMKIPTLVRDDGTALYDSIVICEYLDALGGGTLFPPAGEPRWRALRLNALADGMMDASVLLRYETVMRPEAMRWQPWIDGQFAKVDGALDEAEREAATYPAAFDIGQIALVCALGYLDFRYASRPWRPGRPQLERWFAQRCERESVRATAPVG